MTMSTILISHVQDSCPKPVSNNGSLSFPLTWSRNKSELSSSYYWNMKHQEHMKQENNLLLTIKGSYSHSRFVPSQMSGLLCLNITSTYFINETCISRLINYQRITDFRQYTYILHPLKVKINFFNNKRYVRNISICLQK